MAGPMGFFDYISDDGTTYKLKLDASNATGMGGVTATSTAWYPRGWVPRYVLAFNDTHGRRKVTAPDTADSHWTSNDTIPLEVVGSILPVDFTITARIGEKRTSRG